LPNCAKFHLPRRIPYFCEAYLPAKYVRFRNPPGALAAPSNFS
jgi:hypothetical protein